MRRKSRKESWVDANWVSISMPGFAFCGRRVSIRFWPSLARFDRWRRRHKSRNLTGSPPAGFSTCWPGLSGPASCWRSSRQLFTGRPVGFDYVNYDDPQFITTNPHVLGGLTWENVRWAFGTGLDGNWIPLTWLSYMLDMEWFGPTAAGLHLTNILLHAANTVLVFLLFRRLTGAHWPSAVLAGLFGLHPLHVESVAWVAERKDVLSTSCFGRWRSLSAMRRNAHKLSPSGCLALVKRFIFLLAADFFCIGFDVQTHGGDPAVRAVAAGLLAAAAHRTRRIFSPTAPR